jgi:hypothetical protein
MALSDDLRKRVVEAVVVPGLSRHAGVFVVPDLLPRLRLPCRGRHAKENQTVRRACGSEDAARSSRTGVC